MIEDESSGEYKKEQFMELIEDVLNGDIAAAAKLITIFEDDPEQCRPILDQLAPHTGKAHIIGITGHPGAGKSTLVGA
ncbi:MAG: hypothetical protein ABIJ35_12315, partial [Acidobacteriota bacterium]